MLTDSVVHIETKLLSFQTNLRQTAFSNGQAMLPENEPIGSILMMSANMTKLLRIHLYPQLDVV